MKVVIVGLPQSGKSTLYAAVTGTPVDPYAAPEIHTGIVKVPDERLANLAKICNPKKIVEATIEFVDVPGCAPGDPKGRDEWKRYLPTVRQAEVLVVVVRDFENASVPMFQNRVDPGEDFATFWEELIFADLDTVTTRVERLEKALKKPTKTHEQEKRELAVLLKCRDALEAESPLSTVITGEEDRKAVSSFGFLTQKPVVCVRNVSDDQAGGAEVLALDHVAGSIALSASIEAEIAQLDEADRQEFMADLGLESPARNVLIQTCYAGCGLISFLTMGPDEVRAWPVKKDSSAMEAAGKIHTDIARGFIRAETVAYDELLEHGDMKGAKAAGRVRKEGKTYTVQDGDILNILTSA
ncbi:MAG: redox-regulated ATPase YchF [Planctomycetota bacterium]|jgi:GTP-binding protein YchF